MGNPVASVLAHLLHHRLQPVMFDLVFGGTWDCGRQLHLKRSSMRADSLNLDWLPPLMSGLGLASEACSSLRCSGVSLVCLRAKTTPLDFERPRTLVTPHDRPFRCSLPDGLVEARRLINFVMVALEGLTLGRQR